MSIIPQDGVELADGYQFTKHMDAPYRLAFGHKRPPCIVVHIYSIDRRECVGLLADVSRAGLTTCFSPDGATLYGHNTSLWAKDIQTGVIQTLAAIPHAPAYNQTRLLECSPDNRTLLVEQRAQVQITRRSHSTTATRLCLISTQGTDFRVLHNVAEGEHVRDIVCCWKQGFAVVSRWLQTLTSTANEFCKLDLDSGQFTSLCWLPRLSMTSTLNADGTKFVWANSDNELYSYSLVDGVTRLLPVSGTCPAWSPDGKHIAYMDDQHKLCLWDTAQGRAQDLAWFTPPNLTFRERAGSHAVAPVWSPDGNMLWFALTQTRRLPAPRSLTEAVREAKRYLRPVLRNLNPLRTSTQVSYQPNCNVHKSGVIDLTTRQAVVFDGVSYEPTWLPRPDSPMAAKQGVQTGENET